MRTGSVQMLWQHGWHIASASNTLVRPVRLTFEAWELGHGSGTPARWQTPEFDVEKVGSTWVASAATEGDFPSLDWERMVPILLGQQNHADTAISMTALSEWTARPWHPKAEPGTNIDRLELTLDRVQFYRHPQTQAWMHDIDATLRIYGKGELVVGTSLPRD